MQLTITQRDGKEKPNTLRNKGLLPGVVYGRAQESTPITIDRKTFEKILHAAGESTVITLTGVGDDKDALIHEVEVDPVTGTPTHADFYAIQKGQKVTVAIPFEYDGESSAVKDKGAILVKVMHELEITCEPKDLPHALHVDLSKLENYDDKVTVGDIKLPAGAEISADAEEVVAMAVEAKEEVVEETPADISTIEISEERGKKEEEGAEGALLQPQRKETKKSNQEPGNFPGFL
jgi:large subunit ribosomal protein L25